MRNWHGISSPFGKWHTGRRDAAFSPAALFSASEPGFWAEVSPSTTWTDTARTTPATVGDQVASWQLNTASGAIYATQINVSSRPLLQQTAGGLYYLDFDGLDDSMVTPTTTPGTDKVQVFAGVRKESDAAFAMLLESSASIASNAGAFNITAPSGAAQPTYALNSKGTSLSPATSPTSFASPISSVLSGLGDISGDVATLRINGTQVATSGSDQGTGNFLAYPLYIGARAGTSLFFNGRIHSLIVRFGANLTAEQISNAEAWTAGKTGVVL